MSFSNPRYRCPNESCKYFTYTAFYAKEEPDIKECHGCHTLHVLITEDREDLLTKLAGM